MTEIRGITISVGYADLLAITLIRNMRHLTECLVVTSPEDHATRAVAEVTPGVRLHVTDAFTRHGAAFNKGLAMEEALDTLGRSGWILIWDADIIMPESLRLEKLRAGTVHGAKRATLADVSAWHPDLDWSRLPVDDDGAPVGFFQLFHASDPVLRDTRPWYDVTFAHAGGGDAYFLTHWPPSRKIVLPLTCLHLGPRDTHWFGIDEAAKARMAAFVRRNGWRRAEAGLADVTPAEGDIPERVSVPGYPPSGFELPFVRRRNKVRLDPRTLKPPADCVPCGTVKRPPASGHTGIGTANAP